MCAAIKKSLPMQPWTPGLEGSIFMQNYHKSVKLLEIIQKNEEELGPHCLSFELKTTPFTKGEAP